MHVSDYPAVEMYQQATHKNCGGYAAIIAPQPDVRVIRCTNCAFQHRVTDPYAGPIRYFVDHLVGSEFEVASSSSG